MINRYKVIGYDPEFKGIIKEGNTTLYLPRVIKGETVEADIILKPFAQARLTKVVEPNLNRVKPICEYYIQCGGCALQHINYEEQLRMKQELVSNLFVEAFGKKYEVLPTIGMKDPYYYRNKNQVVFKNVKGKLTCGMYQSGTHNVVNTTNCYIQDKLVDKIISVIKDLMVKQRLSAYDEDKRTGLIRHVLIKTSKATKEVMVVIVVGSDIFPGRSNFVKALTARCKEITTVIQNINTRNTNAVLGDKETVLYGKGYINDILLGLKFKISSKSFYQINPEQTEKLYSEAIKLACLTKADTLLDAYCGVGTIGLIASSHVQKVTGVELVKDAVNDAIMNAKINNINNVRFICDDATRFMINCARQKQTFDVVIMDPPRKGSDKPFLDALLKLLPEKVVYISCNPHTQVEDLKELLKKYDIKKIQPVDMFPHTHHVENIVLLVRK
mgnify:CR=1 FL=1